MAKNRSIKVEFPLGGLDRTMSYQRQAPYTTADCLNVMPKGALEGRARGGSRPGLKSYSGSPLPLEEDVGVQFIDSVDTSQDNKRRLWADYFERESLGNDWTQGSASYGEMGILYGDYDGIAYKEKGELIGPILPVDPSRPFEVAIDIKPFTNDDEELIHCGTYCLNCAMNTTFPGIRVIGFVFEVSLSGDTASFSWRALKYELGNLTVLDSGSNTNTSEGPQEGRMRVVFDDDDTVACYWTAHSTRVPLYDAAYSHGDRYRFGFGAECTVAGGVCLIDACLFQYADIGGVTKRQTKLLCGRGGNVYSLTEDESEEVTPSAMIVSDRPIGTARSATKVYIADWEEERVSADSGATISVDGILTDDAVDDYEPYGTDVATDVCVVSSPSSHAGVYGIDAVEGASVTLKDAPETEGLDVAYKIERAPKVFDAQDNSLRIYTATAGTVPSGCKLIARYRDRIVLANSNDAPHNWYMSRAGDAFDWDYGADGEDESRAVAGQNAKAGLIGEEITALIPYQDDYLIFGHPTELWVLRGDPASGGELDCLSTEIGIISSGAWCKTPGGDVVFLSRDGVYLLASGAQSRPMRFSREKLPRELLNMTTHLQDISMAFDIGMNGVLLFAKGVSVGKSVHYWIDWGTKSFWPLSFKGGSEPVIAFRYDNEDYTASTIIVGGSGGGMYRFSNTSGRDVGGTIDSKCLIGPIRLGAGVGGDGQLDQLCGKLGDGSAPINVSILAGVNASDALRSEKKGTKTWTEGFNVHDCRYRGNTVYILLEGHTSREPWVLEEMEARIRGFGKIRL